jgi:hypothetical protein
VDICLPKSVNLVFMQHKKAFRLITLSVLLCSISYQASGFCGTVRMWHDKYFEAKSNDSRLDALMFLHCQPVVDGFIGTNEQTDLLVSMLTAALPSYGQDNTSESRYRLHLVVKNVARFRLWDSRADKVDRLMSELGRHFQKSGKELKKLLGAIPEDSPLMQDNGLGSAHKAYAEQLEKEISDLGLI